MPCSAIDAAYRIPSQRTQQAKALYWTAIMSTPAQMDHVDRAFFAVDTDAMPQTISAICLLHGLPDWGEVTRQVGAAVQRFPRLQHKVIEHPSLAWTDDENFDLSKHLQIERFDNDLTAEDLLAATQATISLPLDMTRAPWRITLLTSRANNACLVICLHHGAADGVRAMQLLEAITGTSPTMDNAATPLSSLTGTIEPAQRQRTSWFSQCRHGLKCTVKLLREGLIPCSKSRINGPTTCQRSITPIELNRQCLTHVMQAEGVSLHDVIHASVAGGIHDFQTANQQPAKDMRVVVPMAVPSDSDKGGLGNHLVLSTLTLPTSEQNPRARLLQVRDTFARMKSSGTIAAYEFAAWAISKFVPRRLHWPIWKTMIRKTNCVCTILPGPHRPRYLGGVQIEAIYGVPAPVVNHGAAFAFVTYAGGVYGAVTTDHNVLPDGRPLAECITDALQQLAPAALANEPVVAQPHALSGSGLGQFDTSDSRDQRERIAEYVTSLVLDVLGGTTRKEVRPRDRLFELGIDSMMAIDLHLRIQDTFRQEFPKTLILDYPTIESLTEYLNIELAPTQTESASIDTAGTADEELKELTDRQLAAMLQDELSS